MDESFIIANRTDVGRAREHNEDSMVTFDSPNGRVIAVCDGMGGQAAGDLASRLACEIITDILSNNRFSTPTEAITRACMAANQGILHRASQNPELEGMGATCVMVIIKDGLAYYGWVGDSRIYYINQGRISQISRDQSYVQQLVDAGQISAAEAESHPLKNEITNALGLATMTPPELCTSPLSPEKGSVLLLCSDGLTGMVDDNTIESIISDKELPLQKRVDKLVDRANANGGADNITVQLVEFGNRKGGANVRKSTSKGNAADKSKFLLYVTAAVAVVVVAAVLYFTLGGKKTEPKPIIEDKIEDNRSIITSGSDKPSAPAQTSGSATRQNNVGKSEPKQTPNVREKSKQQNVNNKSKGKSNTEKIFGKDKDDKSGGKKSDKNPKNKGLLDFDKTSGDKSKDNKGLDEALKNQR